ncbi:MAG: glycosyltransferase family 2 protein [Acidobacteriota bacterium]
MKPFISVILPCRNEVRSLARCLDSILASSYPADSMEVLVADGLSEDGSRAVLEGFAAKDARVVILDNLSLITPAALNLCIRAARGQYILRVDAHSVIGPNYIAVLIDFLAAHPDAWGAGGRMFTLPEAHSMFSKCISIVLSHRFGVGNSGFRTSGAIAEPQSVDTVFNCCWRREVFDRVGLFHERLIRSQDIELSARIARAGGTLWLVPGADTTYFAKVDFLPYLSHNWLNGIWSVVPAIYLSRLPVRWRHLIPLAFVAKLTVSLAGALLWRIWWLPVLPLGPYAVLNLAFSGRLAVQHRSLKLAVLLPITFAGLHFAYGAGSLWGALRLAVHRLRRVSLVPVQETNS